MNSETKKLQAVILAGGLGTRLWPLTREVPKPMVPVAGAPYLEHQLRLLNQQGFQDIVLLTGYLGEQIEEHFGDGSAFGLTIRYSCEDEPLGTGGALRQAADLLADSFVLIYGDSFLPITYASVLETLHGSAGQGVVVVYDNQLEDSGVVSNISIDENDAVLRYEKDAPDQPDLQYVEAGVLAFRKNAMDLIPTSGIVSLEKEVFPKLVARKELQAHVTQQRFYDIGTPSRLEAIEQFITHDYHTNTFSN